MSSSRTSKKYDNQPLCHSRASAYQLPTYLPGGIVPAIVVWWVDHTDLIIIPSRADRVPRGVECLRLGSHRPPCPPPFDIFQQQQRHKSHWFIAMTLSVFFYSHPSLLVLADHIELARGCADRNGRERCHRAKGINELVAPKYSKHPSGRSSSRSYLSIYLAERRRRKNLPR